MYALSFNFSSLKFETSLSPVFITAFNITGLGMRLLFFVPFFLRFFLCFGQQRGGDDRDKMNTLAERAGSFAKTGNTDSSSFYYNKAIAVAKNLRDSSATARLLVDKGKVHETAGNHSQSTGAYFEGLNISQRLNNKLYEGLCYLGLSNVSFRVANNEAAWEHGLAAMKRFESLHDTAHYIVASMLVGQIEISLGKLDDAEAIYTRMLGVAQKISDNALIADNLDHLGAIHSFRKECSKALAYHEKALRINTKINNQFNVVINNANIGEAYMRMGNYSKGRDFLIKSMDIGKKVNANSVLIFIYYTLGECFSLMGEKTVALENFKQSLELIRHQGEARERPYVYNLLSEHYERNHDAANALVYFKKSSLERDSLRIVSSSYAMEELKTKYEADKRENDLRSALVENSFKETKLAHSNQTINMLFVAIGTALIGLVITVVQTIRLYRGEKKLKLANATKDALLSIIGHDLRGPMRNIEQLTKLIKGARGEEREDYFKMLERPVNATVNLLDDLLEWSRSARQQSISKKNSVNVNEAVNRSIELFREQADSKQIQVNVNVPKGVFVYVDLNHVLSILRNLISNAIKFTPKGGLITIDHKQDNGNVTINVKDTGLGIQPHHIKVILGGRFFSTYGTNNEKGSGFGLMLCQEFVRLNNGSLNIESKVGQGSTISFTLPASPS